MKLLLFFFLAAVLLPRLGGANQRKARFLFGNLFGNNSPPPATTQAPPQPAFPPVQLASFCQGGCRDGWFSYMGQCYMYVPDQMSWERAERACQGAANGGHLTSISSADHNNFLVSLATYQGHRTAQFWTGGSHQKGSSLRWTDGSGANFIQRPLHSLLNMVGNTINSLLNLRICLKLNINVGGQGNWDGSACDKKLPFICSYKPNLLPP
ncbi:snaclec bothrojaracin subunit alpha-like [Eublepharis macularius]|uniref:Snaclec bothrojaracin subunit alpha-like n=1 Tax=Eublepharis macularius TaxID=481883 RepID=A0AA97KTC7_EUBMA|nr:snaclec bothrojaracin subunit alpha-like [Eublepharis macularius]